MKERVHSRNMTIETFDIGNDRLLVEGSLLDERHNTTQPDDPQGNITPRTIHSMVVRMTLSLPDLKIITVESEMPVIPHPDCAEVREAVNRLRGIEIRHGFTESVQRLLGKTEGCLHMMNLVLAMGSAAVQGMWSYMSQKRQFGHDNRPESHNEMLVDSCRVWRKDGPLVARLKMRS